MDKNRVALLLRIVCSYRQHTKPKCSLEEQPAISTMTKLDLMIEGWHENQSRFLISTLLDDSNPQHLQINFPDSVVCLHHLASLYSLLIRAKNIRKGAPFTVNEVDLYLYFRCYHLSFLPSRVALISQTTLPIEFERANRFLRALIDPTRHRYRETIFFVRWPLSPWLCQFGPQ